jgi:hypothetical protein
VNTSKISHPDAYFPFPHFPVRSIASGQKNVGKENGYSKGGEVFEFIH